MLTSEQKDQLRLIQNKYEASGLPMSLAEFVYLKLSKGALIEANGNSFKINETWIHRSLDLSSCEWWTQISEDGFELFDSLEDAVKYCVRN